VGLKKRKREINMLKGVKLNPASNVTTKKKNFRSAQKTVSLQDYIEKLVLIECECGAKILLLPDLKEMNCAIEAHVAEHKKIEKSTMKAKIAVRKIRQNLTQQVIRKAAATKQFNAC
jgi:hypothetical protein